MTLKPMKVDNNYMSPEAVIILLEDDHPVKEPHGKDKSNEQSSKTTGGAMIDQHPKVYVASAIVSIIVGSFSVLNTLFKSWYQVPTPFDWFSLAIGSVMCGLPLLRGFAIKPGSFEAEIRAIKPISES